MEKARRFGAAFGWKAFDLKALFPVQDGKLA
jgi:hypothetical protein